MTMAVPVTSLTDTREVVLRAGLLRPGRRGRRVVIDRGACGAWCA